MAIAQMSQSLSSEIVTCQLIDKLTATAVAKAVAQRDPSVRDGMPFGESVMLDDARLANAFSREHDLENHLASKAFAPGRPALVDLLRSRAALSLENDELRASLEQERSDRRRAEAALRRSEERYALAIEAATEGHGEFIAEEGLFFASPRLLEQWGLPPELMVTQREHMLDLLPFHPDDRERVTALLDEHRDGGTNRLEFDARVIRRGEVRWIHWTTLYLRDATGKLLRSSTATADVTERRRAEEEVRLSEERYALALAGSNEGVFDWDLRTDLIYAPPRTQELLGLPLGEPWRTRAEWESRIEYYPGDQESMQAALDAHFAGLTPMYDHEVRIVLAGGEIRCFRHRGTVLREPDGTPYRMLGSLDDITERKRQQEDMLRLENRLRQAERFEAMGTLAGGIAHDFNNILGAILGFGERALRMVETGSRLHHDLSNVVAAGERGRTLVDRILSFSRGTAGEPVPVHAERAVSEALSLLHATLPARIGLRSELHAGNAAILGDAVQIHQLLMNLGTNAAHAMAQAGTLTVSLEAIEVVQARQATLGAIAKGPWIVLRVADEGRGMTPEILSRIFDPFFTTKEAGVGTGLGLSLVLRIVSQAGGAIDVESTPDAGSVFTVYLPRAGDAPAEPPDPRPAVPQGQAQRVMVVDDEQPLLELTTDALRALDYRPIGYGSARVALEAFRSTPDEFDVLIVDLRMPGMSGDMLIREVRRVRPLLPVILMSGYVDDAALSPWNGWADEVLTKPLRTNALATSLARLLDAA